MPAERTPIVETQTVSETRKTFSETLDRVYRGEARVIVERSGIAVGVVVSPRDLAALERLDQQRRRGGLRVAPAETRSAFESVPTEEKEREVEEADAEVRNRLYRDDPWRVLDDMRKAFAGSDDEEFERELDKAIHDVKAEYDRRRSTESDTSTVRR